MPRPTVRPWILAAVGAVLLAGCSGNREAVREQAQLAYEHLLATRAASDAQATNATTPVWPPVSRPANRLMLFSERPGAGPAEPTRESAAADPPEKAEPRAGYESLDGLTFGEIVKRDLKDVPRMLWSGAKLSFGNPTNLAILAGAFGADRIVRGTVDDDVRHHLRRHSTSLRETGDFGEITGHPGLHFAAAAAWYLASIESRDEKNHQLSKVLIEALAVNGITTQALQMSVNQHDPRGDKYGWPSGHTSSSFCVASVLHEYYGWQVGAPAYLLSGYLAATRVGDRRHNVSDVVFGTALGLVIGHSVVRGELPTIGGFTLLPYGGMDGAGVMLSKSF
jgi:hypothetical protein